MEVEAEWAKRATVPDYVFKMIKSMPKETHPMTLFSQAVLALQNGSVFAHKYHSMKKDDYWEAALEDSLDLTAKLPVIAAYHLSHEIFRRNIQAEIQSQAGLWYELRPHDEGRRTKKAMRTSPACISSCTATMSLGTFRRTRCIWSARRFRTHTFPSLPR